jgi:magnesium-transporting ATPase (P-type)
MSSFAHFSSLDSKLPSIIDLLRVCRAGLSTNFQTFKMMCQFSLMEFTTMVILYLNYEELNNTESLYIDLFVMCPIFVTLCMTEPCSTLSKYVPPASLFSLFNLLSMLGLFLIQLLGQIFIVERLKR